jgi:hypothetical protein
MANEIKQNPKGRVDKYPDASEKTALRTSTSTTLRYRDPTNAQTASKVPNYVFDHSNQMRIWPDQRPRALIETTQKETANTYRTMNRSGHPYALGVNVGGSPDDPGTPFTKSRKAKVLK